MSKFVKGKSGNPEGRPRGVPDRRTLLSKVLYDDVGGVLAVVVRAALAGDLTACKLVLDKTIPSLRAIDRPIYLPAGDAGSVVSAMASGDITPDQAVQAASVLLTVWKVRELSEFEQRLSALEARHGEAI